MGTQFTSRLTKLDRRRILDEIQTARKSAAPTAGAKLSKQQARAYAHEAVRGVLTVAGGRGLIDEFGESEVFEEVLTWLKSLWNDASFNGFRTSIAQYRLEQESSPVTGLTKKLKEITDKYQKDIFRVAVSNAANAVLIEGVTPAKPEETASRAYGRKLAKLHVRDIVQRFVGSFLYEFIIGMASKADPYSASGVVLEFNRLSAEEVGRIARKIVKRLNDEGKINDVKRTREITIEELLQLVKH